MGIFSRRPAKNKSDGSVAAPANVGTAVGPDALLRQVAQVMEISDINQRWAAADACCEQIKQVTDQAVLACIAKIDGFGTVIQAALGKIEDFGTLLDIARTGESDFAGELVMEKLPELDQQTATELAQNAVNAGARAKATGQVTDEQVLLQIIATEKVARVLLAASKQLDNRDQSVLLRVAMDTDDVTASGEAVKLMTDQAMLLEVAKNCSWHGKTAFEMLGELPQAVYADLALNAQNWELPPLAARKITDLDLLAQVAQQTTSTKIKEEAATRLPEAGQLAAEVQATQEKRRKENEMPLRCPQCGTTIKLVNKFNMNEVYQDFDLDNSGRCPGCGFQYRQG